MNGGGWILEGSKVLKVMMDTNTPVDISLPALRAATERLTMEVPTDDLAGQRMLTDFNRVLSLMEEGPKVGEK